MFYGHLAPRPWAGVSWSTYNVTTHAEHLAPLARLIARASEHTQIILVTHAKTLISALREQAGCNSITLEKKFGETAIRGSRELDLRVSHWLAR